MRNIFLFLLSILIIIIGLFFFSYISNLPSSKQKKEYQRVLEKEGEIRKSLEAFAVEAGFLKRRAGYEEFYVPSLTVRIKNKSHFPIGKLIIKVYFEVEQRRLCLASALINEFHPGEATEVVLKCLEATGFGTIFKGLSLIHTAKKVTYEVYAEANGISISLLKGDIEFKILAHQ